MTSAEPTRAGGAPYYVTTPIYYANAEPHIGHTYTSIVADTLVRWRRQHGDDTWSVSGTDEHGEKMVEAAAQRGIDPAALAARLEAWQTLRACRKALVQRNANPQLVAERALLALREALA